MSKRRRKQARPARRPFTDRQKLLGVLALPLAVVLIVGGVQVAAWFRRGPAEPGHAHDPPPRGGLVVAIGAGDQHYHLEVIREKGGFLLLYPLGSDARQVAELDSQILTAQVRSLEGGGTSALTFMPFPLPADKDGKTSRFLSKLPRELHGGTLTVAIAPIAFGRSSHPARFTLPAASGAAAGAINIFLVPGGKYLDADIAANGRPMPEEMFCNQRAHDLKPRPGDRICPITRAKARADCTWIVYGGGYQFCCAPCIERFVQAAKEQPDTIKGPETYVRLP